jgi:two-component system cell cycle sensor histidine kinase/response regulator CckA
MKSVLILDDEPSLLQVVKLFLKHGGYKVAQAQSPASAVQQFLDLNGRLDLLIADVTLAVSSGVEVAVDFKSRSSTLKVILMSGYPADGWGEHDAALLAALPSESVRVLQKPFSSTGLLLLVRELIGSGESLQAAP